MPGSEGSHNSHRDSFRYRSTTVGRLGSAWLHAFTNHSKVFETTYLSVLDPLSGQEVTKLSKMKNEKHLCAEQSCVLHVRLWYMQCSPLLSLVAWHCGSWVHVWLGAYCHSMSDSLGTENWVHGLCYYLRVTLPRKLSILIVVVVVKPFRIYVLIFAVNSQLNPPSISPLPSNKPPS